MFMEQEVYMSLHGRKGSNEEQSGSGPKDGEAGCCLYAWYPSSPNKLLLQALLPQGPVSSGIAMSISLSPVLLGDLCSEL